MIMDDFSVWLIEINSHPDMSYSTSVTARLCRQVMEDTIKGNERFDQIFGFSRINITLLIIT